MFLDIPPEVTDLIGAAIAFFSIVFVAGCMLVAWLGLLDE